MTIAEIIAKRGISRILHFTTNNGLLGTLASHRVLSRRRLPREKYLEHVYTPNCQVRFDPGWIDYVNLSIQRINSVFFDICANKWHAGGDVWWCVLSFDPVILTHKDVWFATTNNRYTGVAREKSAAGLEALYAPRIVQYTGSTVARRRGQDSAEPTCRQAEVLYPGSLSIEYLRNVFLPTEEHADLLAGQMCALNFDEDVISYTVDRSIFS